MTDEFDAARAAQFLFVAKQLAAIRTLRPARKRQRFVIHEITCRDCGKPVVQVFDVRMPDGAPVLAVSYRRLKPADQELPVDMPPAERAAAMAARKPSRQLDDWEFVIITRDDVDDSRVGRHRQLLFAACVCSGERQFTMAGILGRPGEHSTVDGRSGRIGPPPLTAAELGLDPGTS